MNTNSGTNIKKILSTYPKGTVVTAREMLRFGISRDLLRSFVRSGWLTPVGVGVYLVLDGELNLQSALRALQTGLNLSIHPGGYSALSEKHGKTHNLYVYRKEELFAYRGEKLPAWFSSAFVSDCLISFTTFLPAELGLEDIEAGGLSIKISSIERAMLEMIYLTPTTHTLRETYQIMELLVTVKPLLVQELLESCTSVKVKRLFLHMAERAGHAWSKRLDLSRVKLGSGIREIEKGGKLDRTYGIVIGDVSDI